MKEVLLLKCGEIVLKGLNRKTFEDRLLKNLKRRMAHVADCEITMRQSVVYVEIPDDADADAVMELSLIHILPPLKLFHAFMFFSSCLCCLLSFFMVTKKDSIAYCLRHCPDGRH